MRAFVLTLAAAAALLPGFVSAQPAPSPTEPGHGGAAPVPPMSQSVPPPPTTTPPDATGTPYSNAPNAPPVTPAPNPNAGLDAQPIKGANSFTQAQAQARMAGRGFSDIRDLARDRDGIWRAAATRQGRAVHVWLDYQGRVGIQ